MPERIYKSKFPVTPIFDCSIWTLLGAMDRFPYAEQTAAFVDARTGTTITRKEMKLLCLAFAYGLRTHLPKVGGNTLRRGSTILVFSPNSLAYPLLVFGSFAAGFKVTLANSAYTSRELAYQWKDSRADLLFVHPDSVQAALDMFQHIGVPPQEAKKYIVLASYRSSAPLPSGFITLESLLDKGSFPHEEKFDGPGANETVLMCYSSGTTGQPKGVESSHRNVIAALLQSVALYPFVVHERDTMLGFLPFYHIFGVASNMMLAYYLGVPLVIMEKYEHEYFCWTIEKYGITFTNIVPPVLLKIVQHPATDKYNLRTLRTVSSGAAPLPLSLAQAVKAKFRRIGVDIKIGNGYGATETSPASVVLLPPDGERKIGSVGLLIPNMEARIINEDEDGNVVDAEPGEPGELWVRGPNVMKGYFGNATATKSAVTPDGWYKTGDVVIMDDEQYFFVVDRRKELIKYNGFQVPPAELESVLLSHPDINDAAVIGVDSLTEATELPRAYIVPAKPLNSDAEKAKLSHEIQEWIKTKVAKHKYLRGGVVIIDEVPRSGAGKILRKNLRERAKEEARAAGAGVKSKL